MTLNFQPTSDTRLHGRWLTAVRVVFVTLAVLMLGVGFVSYVTYARVVGQVCATTDECQSGLRFTPAEASDFEQQGVPLELMVALRFGSLASVAIVSCVIGVLIAALRPDDWMALFVALFLIGLGALFNSGPPGALIRAYPFVSPLVILLTELTYVQFPLFFALFPNGRVVPHWMRWLTPLWCIYLTLITFMPNAIQILSRQPYLYFLVVISTLAMFASLMSAQVIRYRRYATPRERQQTKWVVVGVVLLLGIIILTALVGESTRNLFGNPVLFHIVGTLGFNLSPAILPIFIGIAILRSHLWDIDVIIRRTLQYSVLSGLLALVYFGGVVILQRIFTTLTGQGQNQLVAVLSTLAIAALFNPVRRRVQDLIDRRFYRKKYDAAKTLAAFAATVRDETDLDKLAASLIAVVQETMQPESVSLWLKDSNATMPKRNPYARADDAKK
jgi:hypothetical protein